MIDSVIMKCQCLRWLYDVSTKKITKFECFRLFATPQI